MSISIDIPNWDENGCPCEKITGQTYIDFLDLFFKETDYFMLVYPRKNLSENQILFKNKLQPFEYKKRYAINHPGTEYAYQGEPFLEMIFYRTDEKAKEILKEVDELRKLSFPNYPEDIVFYSGKKCRFFSVAHEYMGCIIHATEEDIDFLKKHDLYNIKCVDELPVDFSKWDEEFLEE